MGRKTNAADQKATHARNCELVDLAIRAGKPTVATNYIRATQGRDAAAAAFRDELDRRRG